MVQAAKIGAELEDLDWSKTSDFELAILFNIHPENEIKLS